MGIFSVWRSGRYCKTSKVEGEGAASEIGQKAEHKKSWMPREEGVSRRPSPTVLVTAGVLDKMETENLLSSLNNVETVITLSEVLVAYGVKS